LSRSGLLMRWVLFFQRAKIRSPALPRLIGSI
jgi:hypothetical protein